MARHRWQTALTFVGVMLGVAMVVSVDLANSSARRAFELSLESVAGPATHHVLGGPRGIPESVYTRLRTEAGLRRSAPMMIGRVRIQGQPFTLVGTDPFAEAALQRHVPLLRNTAESGGSLKRLFLKDNAVVSSERAARRLDLNENESFTIELEERRRTAFLAAVYQSDNPAATEGLLLADIAAAQSLLERFGVLDRIDLILEDDEVAQLKQWLPDGLTLVESEARSGHLKNMAEAFHINLTAMSLLALLVGALLIYNTVTLSVLQRRPTLGIYRSLGVTRREVFTLVLGEAAILAVPASIAGVGVGLLLGHSLVELVTRTVHEMYFYLHVTRFLVDPLSLVKGFALGVIMALAAAALPALEAARSTPVSVQQRSVLERRRRLQVLFLFAGGGSAIATGIALAGREQGSLIEGFVALALIVFGFCVMVPHGAAWLTRAGALAAPWLNSTARMALRGIHSGISRTGPAVAALTLAVSVTVGVGTMVGSFRHTLELWLTQSLDGDIYVSPAGGNSSRSDATLPPDLVEQLSALPGVAAVRANLNVRVETEFGRLRLMAVTPRPADRQRMPLKTALDNAVERFRQGRGVLISEPLAYHQKLGSGDAFEMETDYGPVKLLVLGVFHDYTSNLGLIAMPMTLYRTHWNDERISGLILYRDTHISQTALLQSVRETTAARPEPYRVRSNEEIRAESLAVFDRTFAITHVLRLLAVIVAFVGILSALIALQLERIREFAILRATGMTPRQIVGLVLGQTGLMGLLSGLLSIPLGLIMADILIAVINRRAFGWSMQQIVPGGVIVEALALAVTAALIAGIYPAVKAATRSPATGLREE